MKLIFCILALLCPYVYGLAQPIKSATEGLKIGDTFPDIIINNLRNHPEKSISFTAFQADITIVDFWATWCGACIEFLPKMHNLQQKYAGSLKILMVNSYYPDDTKKVDAFFKRRKIRTGKDFTLPYLLQDSLLSSFFPHKVIPHCVWLDRNRKVIAITEGTDVSDANIAAVLKGDKPSMAFKDDALLFDDEKNQLLGEDATKEDLVLHRSFLTKEQKGLGNIITYERAATGGVKMLRVINYSLLALYQLGNAEVFKHGINRLIVDPGLITLIAPNLDEKQRVKYCYEQLTAPTGRKEIQQGLRNDLERYFNIRAVAEQRILNCYVLSAGPSIQNIHSKQLKPSADLDEASLQPHIYKAKMEELREFLEGLLGIPVLDETSVLENIDIDFPAGFLHYDSAQVVNFLKSCGINMQSTQRSLWVPRLTAILKQ